MKLIPRYPNGKIHNLKHQLFYNLLAPYVAKLQYPHTWDGNKHIYKQPQWLWDALHKVAFWYTT